jgi:hypothetical protein
VSGNVRVAALAYLPGISVDEITSPPLKLVFDANTTTYR